MTTESRQLRRCPSGSPARHERCPYLPDLPTLTSARPANSMLIVRCGCPALTDSRTCSCTDSSATVTGNCVWQLILAHLWQLTLARLWQFAKQHRGMEIRWASGWSVAEA